MGLRRVVVTTNPKLTDRPRYRAGLGPFGARPVTIEVTDWEYDLLKSDPALLVTETPEKSAPSVKAHRKP